MYVSESTDLAILNFAVSDAPYLDLENSDRAIEGQRVVVVGNPENLTGTASDGIIAAFRAGGAIIQITAPLSPGSSGSPVLNCEDGKVIGVVEAYLVTGQNLNFAINAFLLKYALALVEAGKVPPENSFSAFAQQWVTKGTTSGHDAFAEEEQELNRVYQQLRHILDKASRDQLRREELGWLAERPKLKPRSGEFLAVTQQRTKELRERLWSLRQQNP